MNYLCVGHDFGVINMRSQAYITEAVSLGTCLIQNT
mgnify:CR=1 FL=1